MFEEEKFEDMSHLLVRPRFEGEFKAFRWYLFKGKVTKDLKKVKSWTVVRKELFGLGESLRNGG